MRNYSTNYYILKAILNLLQGLKYSYTTIKPIQDIIVDLLEQEEQNF